MATTYPTTQTTTFNLNLNDCVEEAFERCGAELRSGYDFRTARRSLNLLLLDWANRGYNLWTVDSGSIPMVAGVITYTLPLDTVDLIEHVIRTGVGINQTDISIARISNSTYATIPNKLTTGQPLQVWVNRLSGALQADSTVATPTITVWPAPDVSSTYTFVYWRLRRLQEAGTGINGQDIPYRFLPPLVSGLAYYLALKIPGATDRLEVLKGIYDADWTIASEEDREKATLRLVPRIMNIG
jgi:hypothetical protein